MSTQSQRKKQLIQQIMRLQDDFQVLTQRSNNLQHENQYYQTQLEDAQMRRQAKKVQGHSQVPNQSSEYQEPEWPIYLKVDNQNLPQQPTEFVKFVGADGRHYVQNLQLVQYMETSPDGKSQRIVREEYMAVQQPLEIFEQHHGPFSQIGSVSSQNEDLKKQSFNQNKMPEKQ